MAEAYNSIHTGVEIDAAISEVRALTGTTSQIVGFNADGRPVVRDLDVYSTEETVVGRWIDGRPLYRKAYIGSYTLETALNRQIITLETSSVAGNFSLKRAFGALYTVSGQTHLIPSFDNSSVDAGYPNSANRHVNIGHTTNLYMTIREWANCLTGTFEVVVEYTKTTDTATIAIPTAAEMTAAYNEGVQSA